MVDVGVEPKPLQSLLEGPFGPQGRGRPRSLARALGHPADQQCGTATTMAHTNVQARVPIQHATINQGGHGQGLLCCEPGNDVQLKPLQRRVAGRAIDPGRSGMNEQGHVQPDRFGIHQVHRCIIQRSRRISAERGPDQSELVHRTAQLLRGVRGRLQRQGGKSSQFVRMLLHDRRQRIVMHPAKLHGLLYRDEVQIGQRVGRDHLKVDAPLRHAAQADIDIHKRAANVLDPIEPVVLPDLKKGRTVRVATHERTVLTRGANRLFQHDVRMQIHYLGVRQSQLLHIFLTPESKVATNTGHALLCRKPGGDTI